MTKQNYAKTLKSEKGKSKQLYWSFAIPAIAICIWALEIGNDTMASYNRWYIPFAIIGFAIGIIRLLQDKGIVWNWKEYLGGAFYALVHSAMAMLIATVVFSTISLLNFYIPTNHAYYEETATAIYKSYSDGKRRSYYRYHITFHFENEKIRNTSIGVSKPFYNQSKIGDTYTFTLQNGFFNIPVIKAKAKQEKGERQ